MNLLTDYTWATKYDSDISSLIQEFYEPALNCAVRYDRSTGFFSARILTLAARGIEDLIRNNGVMRLVIDCTLKEEEVEAIAKGEELKKVVDRSLSSFPLMPENIEQADALEHLKEEERSFAKLWTNQAKRCLVIDVPTAVKAQFLSYLPQCDRKPKRLERIQEVETRNFASFQEVHATSVQELHASPVQEAVVIN